MDIQKVRQEVEEENMEKKQITEIAMTGKELLKSAGLNQNHIYSLLDSLRQEWDFAMIRPSGAYSVGYVEEKLSKILDCFKDIDKEKARLRRLITTSTTADCK